MPEFNVEIADVNMKSKAVDVDVPTMDVETKTIEIEVPVDVDAGTESTTLELPTIEIDRPEEDNPANNVRGKLPINLTESRLHKAAFCG